MGVLSRGSRHLVVWSALPFMLLPAAGMRGDTEPEKVRVPAELIRQLFREEGARPQVKRRPFELGELAALLKEPRFRDALPARELTRRYLKLTYPAGVVSIASVVDASLPDEALEQLFAAPEGAVRFTLSGDLASDLETLSKLPDDARRALLDASANVVTAALPDRLDLAAIERLDRQRYGKLVPYWGANIYVRNSGQEQFLTSSPTSEHLLAELLTRYREQDVRCAMEAASCTLEVCTSKVEEGGFASVKFIGSEGLYLAPGDQILASCRYESIYRREFEDRIEREVAFDHCKLLEVNGEPVGDDGSLLRDLVGIE